jgi:hypothetical protein
VVPAFPAPSTAIVFGIIDSSVERSGPLGHVEQ